MKINNLFNIIFTISTNNIKLKLSHFHSVYDLIILVCCFSVDCSCGKGGNPKIRGTLRTRKSKWSERSTHDRSKRNQGN